MKNNPVELFQQDCFVILSAITIKGYRKNFSNTTSPYFVPDLGLLSGRLPELDSNTFCLPISF